MNEIKFAQKAIILNKAKSHILVQKYLSSKYSPAKLIGKYALPGGKIEFGEEPDDSLIREVYEETGVSIKPAEPIDVWTWIYDKEDSKMQIVAVSRISHYIDGELIDPNLIHIEKETTISKAEWLEIKNIKLEDFVYDEQKSVKILIEKISFILS
jgi:8-oxo-dGTP pyrophosphatase MutT (NUDIX family)